MNKERILKLADHLENLPEAAVTTFNMRVYYEGPEDARPGDCGTEACALGYATQVDEFHEAGLGFVEGCITWRGSPDDEIGGAVELFDLTPRQASYLFCPQDSVNASIKRLTPKQWAKRARAFVANGGALPDDGR